MGNFKRAVKLQKEDFAKIVQVCTIFQHLNGLLNTSRNL